MQPSCHARLQQVGLSAALAHLKLLVLLHACSASLPPLKVASAGVERISGHLCAELDRHLHLAALT
jgi:hypothetical protein